MENKNVVAVIILGLVAIVLVVILSQGKAPTTGTTSVEQESSSAGSSSNSNMPHFAPHAPFVESVVEDYSPTLIRYNFIGRIAELTAGSNGTALVMDISDPNFPRLVITKDVRISSYNPATKESAPLKVTDLQIGMAVNLTVDFEKNNQQWLFRDVYVLSDR